MNRSAFGPNKSMRAMNFICTAPEARGRGLGTRLMEAALAELGSREVVLDAQVQAQGMYARFGFHPVGIRRNYYAELHEDALIMWTDDIRDAAYHRRLEAIVASLPDGIRPA